MIVPIEGVARPETVARLQDVASRTRHLRAGQLGELNHLLTDEAFVAEVLRSTGIHLSSGARDFIATWNARYRAFHRMADLPDSVHPLTVAVKALELFILDQADRVGLAEGWSEERGAVPARRDPALPARREEADASAVGGSPLGSPRYLETIRTFADECLVFEPHPAAEHFDTGTITNRELLETMLPVYRVAREAGLTGLELNRGETFNEVVLEVAERLGLHLTVGSDCHSLSFSRSKRLKRDRELGCPRSVPSALFRFPDTNRPVMLTALETARALGRITGQPVPETPGLGRRHLRRNGTMTRFASLFVLALSLSFVVACESSGNSESPVDAVGTPDVVSPDAGDVGEELDAAVIAEVSDEEVQEDAGAPDAGEPEPTPPVAWVDPFIGTGSGGCQRREHPSPGRGLPFGMMNVSPDTASWAGRHARAALRRLPVRRPVHRGLSPTCICTARASAITASSWSCRRTRCRARCRSRATTARPVISRRRRPLRATTAADLPDLGVHAELTATERTALHRYTWEEGREAVVLIDLAEINTEGTVTVGDVDILPEERRVRGMIHGNGPFSRRHGGYDVWFDIVFDRDFASYGLWDDAGLQAGASHGEAALSEQISLGLWLTFDNTSEHSVQAQVAVSFVDADGAAANLAAEDQGFDFDGAVTAAREAWADFLGAIEIRGTTDDERTIFYTAMYHSAMMPTLFSDVDGRYRSIDDESSIQQTDGWGYYTDLSMWDTFRTLHPLTTMLWPTYARDFARSLVRMAEEGGTMPAWPQGGGYTGSMIGSPADCVLAGTYLKGVTDFDANTALAESLKVALGENTHTTGATPRLPTTSTATCPTTSRAARSRRASSTPSRTTASRTSPRRSGKTRPRRPSASGPCGTATCGTTRRSSSARRTAAGSGSRTSTPPSTATTTRRRRPGSTPGSYPTTSSGSWICSGRQRPWSRSSTSSSRRRTTPSSSSCQARITTTATSPACRRPTCSARPGGPTRRPSGRAGSWRRTTAPTSVASSATTTAARSRRGTSSAPSASTRCPVTRATSWAPPSSLGRPCICRAAISRSRRRTTAPRTSTFSRSP